MATVNMTSILLCGVASLRLRSLTAANRLLALPSPPSATFHPCRPILRRPLTSEPPQPQFSYSRKPPPRKPPRTTKERSQTTLFYLLSLAVATAGASYAAVPLYRVFCQSTGFGGTVQEGHDAEKVSTMEEVPDRVVEVRFTADTAATMQWNFRPQQPVVRVHPGETALAFYTAKNPTDKPIDGISTYNVIPFEAGQYFNKIQCFCFEEQRLNPHEEVDMPVFFYLDPEYAKDPFLEGVDTITLSYTFFESRPGLKLPMPYDRKQ